jgi:acetyl-CoA carboxylase carboxyltransferase component
MDLHDRIGTVDVLVDDEADALAAARRYLGYFLGDAPVVDAPADPVTLRQVVPENPRRAYDVRRIVEGIADAGTVLELRPRWGRCVSTTLVRLGGRAVGVIANNPMFGAGAIDRDGSDKISRHIELCNAFDLPLVFLCDTPGFMIGPAAEQTALVRHSARTLMALANIDVPVMSIIVRKAYGLGYNVMGSDAFAPDLLLGWPTAEFGGMGLEGAVNIVFRDELEAAPDEDTRKEIRARRTAELKERNTGLRYAQGFALDDIVDPAETRDVLMRALATFPAPPPRTGRKHPIDPW